MANESVSTDLEVPPDKAWAMISDFHGLAGWFPGIDSCTAEGDVRVLSMMGLEVREQLIERDDTAHKLVYSIVGGVPIERHRATITVAPIPTGSHVEWAFEVEPESMVPLLRDSYNTALQALGERLS